MALPSRKRHRRALQTSAYDPGVLHSSKDPGVDDTEAKGSCAAMQVIPDELVQSIFSYLSPRDIWSCLGVSTLFRSWALLYLSISITVSNGSQWMESRDYKILQHMLASDRLIFRHTRRLIISLYHNPVYLPMRRLPQALILGILESATSFKTLSIQLSGHHPAVRGLKNILEMVSTEPNIRTTISIRNGRHDPNLDLLALLKIIQRSVSSIEMDANYFINQFQTQDVEPFFYSLRDYNALEKFRILGDEPMSKIVNWKTLLPESIRNLILIRSAVIRALPTNLQELEISGWSRVVGRNLTVIFKLQSLRKLSLLDVDISDKDIPAEFWSHGLSTFKFRYGGRADPIVSLMNVITCGCPGLQILEL
jgi:hypothetical protein